MSIADKPSIMVRREGDVEFTFTPVAFRPSPKHPWRSFEDGNPRYQFDLDAFYTAEITQAPGSVLYIRTERFLGVNYETKCIQCGKHFVIDFPSTWTPRPISATCTSCIAANTSRPQDAQLYYTREYQESLKARHA